MTAVDDLVDEMAALLGAPCTLEDPDFGLLGFSIQREVDPVRQRSILERRSTPEVRAWFAGHGVQDAVSPLRTPADAELGIVSRVCVPVRHRGRLHGFFWLMDPDRTIDESRWPEALRLAESAAELLGLAERRQAHRDALYREVVEGGPQTARQAAMDLASGAGLRMDQSVTCVVIDRPGFAEQLASRPTRTGTLWVRDLDGISAAVVRADLLRADLTTEGVLAALGLARRVPDLDESTLVGIGPSVATIDHLAHARRGALVALRVSRERGPSGVTAWPDLGPLTLLGIARDGDLAQALLPPRVRAFVGDSPPELVRTARTYLDAAGSVGRTAELLGVHRQTVYHRLGQVERLTGLDLAQGRDRLELHLALVVGPFVLGGAGR